MSRRLPLCAWCGERLAGTGRVTICWEKEPGKPEVGWHAGRCAEKDPCFKSLIDNDTAPYPNALMIIEAREQGRVVRNKGGKSCESH